MLCVSIAEKGVAQISALIKTAEMAEIRIEKSGMTVDEVHQLFNGHKQLVATCRPDGLSTKQRQKLLKAAIDAGAAWVDIEIESDVDYISEIYNYAKSKGCRVIISYHNYDKTPDNEALNKIIIQAISYKPDLVKIATQVVTMQDSARLLALYQYKIPLLAIGMGSLGKITRIAALELGAPFTFVSADAREKTASGQLSESKVHEILNALRSV